MTRRANIPPASEIEHLLRLLARESDRANPARPPVLSSLMTAIEWSARMMPLSIAALIGTAMTLLLVASGDTVRRAHAEIDMPNRSAKSDRLFHRFNALFPEPVQVAAPIAAFDATANSRFAFIRGGVDNVTLGWTPPRQKATETSPKRPRKFRRTHRRIPTQPVRTALSPSQRRPWLLDVLIRHIARGS
jgi:hypothetical protein